MIHIEDLSHEFDIGDNKIKVLKSINMVINEGEIIVIQGRSGSGKSTLLNILGGFMKPSAGLVKVYTNSLTTMNEKQLSIYRRNYVGFIFQQFHLFSNMSALNNIEEPLFFAGVKKKIDAKEQRKS